MTDQETATHAAHLIAAGVVHLTRLGNAGGPNATDYMNVAQDAARLVPRIGGIAGVGIREIITNTPTPAQGAPP